MTRWWRRLVAGVRWDGRAGPPRSANGASSFHLTWQVPPGAWVAAEATLEIVTAPSVDALSFWALQVSFVEDGRHRGAAHLGLQWHPHHPGRTAVNWGGYDPGGGELPGSTSALPSATDNPNTRDLPWAVGAPYRLRIARHGPVDPATSETASARTIAWRGSVTGPTGETVVVRDLHVRARHLADPMVWSEVFADCDAPATEVRWRQLALTDEQGRVAGVDTVRVSYQTVAEGGCARTDSTVEAGALVQRTSVRRVTPQGALLSVSRS